MRKFLSALLLFTLICQPAFAFPLKPNFTDSAYTNSRIAALWQNIERGQCISNSRQELSPERTELLLGRMLTEEITASETVELFQGTLQFRCGLSGDAQKAFDALITEAKIRRFDLQAVSRGEVELVVESTMPREFEALLVESGHDPSPRGGQEKTPILVIGCWVAINTGVGLIGACINDVHDAQEDCLSGRVCNPTGPTSGACCDSKAGPDLTNCIASGGTNGPDRDYGNCCI